MTNIGANLIAIISFVSFINAVLQWFGSLVGADYLTFEFVLGKIFVPISWLMGVENDVSGMGYEVQNKQDRLDGQGVLERGIHDVYLTN